jgi:hypothetical protein
MCGGSVAPLEQQTDCVVAVITHFVTDSRIVTVKQCNPQLAGKAGNLQPRAEQRPAGGSRFVRLNAQMPPRVPRPRQLRGGAEVILATSRADAVVQNFHLGSNVIPAEMRGYVLTSSFSHLSGEDKISGQQADG